MSSKTQAQVMNTGDKIVSISKTGKRKGQQGTLVKKMEGMQKWVVRWADGAEKPYAASKLKKVSKDSDERVNNTAGKDANTSVDDLVTSSTIAEPGKRASDDVEGTTSTSLIIPNESTAGTANNAIALDVAAGTAHDTETLHVAAGTTNDTETLHVAADTANHTETQDAAADTGINEYADETEESDELSDDIGAAISAFIAENTAEPVEYERDAMYDGFYAPETGEEVTDLPFDHETGGAYLMYDDEIQDGFDDEIGPGVGVYGDGTEEGVAHIPFIDENDEEYDGHEFFDNDTRDETYIDDPEDTVDGDLIVGEEDGRHIDDSEVPNKSANEINGGHDDKVEEADNDASFNPDSDEGRRVDSESPVDGGKTRDQVFEKIEVDDDDVGVDRTGEADVSTDDGGVNSKILSEDQKVGVGVDAVDAVPVATLVVVDDNGAERLDLGKTEIADAVAFGPTKKVGKSDGPLVSSLEASGTDKPKDAGLAETASPASLLETSGVAKSVDAEAIAIQRKSNAAMGSEDEHEMQLADDEGEVSDGFTDDEDDVQEEDVPRGPVNPISQFSAALIAKNEVDDDRDDLSDGFEDTEKADDEDVHQPEASRQNRILHLNTVTAMLVDDEGEMSDGFSQKTDSGNEEELLVATVVTCRTLPSRTHSSIPTHISSTSMCTQATQWPITLCTLPGRRGIQRTCARKLCAQTYGHCCRH